MPHPINLQSPVSVSLFLLVPPGVAKTIQFKPTFRMFKVIPRGRFHSVRQFQILQNRKVGCGSFGTVKLARHKSTCRLYAMKIIDLAAVPSQSEAKLVEREIRLHSEIDHPQIIRLWDTLLEGEKLYMVMEYAEGGNLFAYQNQKMRFSEPEAFKFFTQTLAGVRYLHQLNIIHRDLKPENLLLDACLNIKICDFGWCAEDARAKRTTFCGTYEYMAPEMLFKGEYDYRVDIWALGVLLYEMLHGFAPFKGKSANEVQQAMLAGKYEFASHLSEGVKGLISHILQFQPEKRASIEEVMRHPWVIDMSTHINSYLDEEGAALPKEVQAKFSNIPDPTPSQAKQPGFTPKHRKNNSLNFQQGRNININLQINNYAFLGKNPHAHAYRGKNTYHSQEKQKDGYEFQKEDCPKTSIKKSKMDPVCKTQISELDVYRVLQKAKSSKNIKTNKEASIKKDESKKKLKLRRSQMEISDKVPVRFNTEAFDKDEWIQPRMKKGHVKPKTNHTKSSLNLKVLKKD